MSIVITTQNFPKEYVQNADNTRTEKVAETVLEIHITVKIITLKWTWIREMDINQEEYIKLFTSLKKNIELLEASDPNNENIDELKLILSDNVSQDGKIHNRSSLMNKKFHLFYLNYKDCMHKYEKDHLYN